MPSPPSAVRPGKLLCLAVRSDPVDFKPERAVLLWGCDSAGPTAQEELEETENEPEPALTLLGETQREGIRLDWEGENLGDKDYFRIYRGTEAGFDTSGAAIADTSATALVDVGHTPSAEYYDRVGAFDEKDGPIVLSDEERTLSPPGEPTGLEGEGQLYRSALQWESAEAPELDLREEFPPPTPKVRLTINTWSRDFPPKYFCPLPNAATEKASPKSVPTVGRVTGSQPFDISFPNRFKIAHIFSTILTKSRLGLA